LNAASQTTVNFGVDWLFPANDLKNIGKQSNGKCNAPAKSTEVLHICRETQGLYAHASEKEYRMQNPLANLKYLRTASTN
jgi:hypothetical protein